MSRFARGARQHPDRQDRPPEPGPSRRPDGLRDREDLRRRRPCHRRAAAGRPVHARAPITRGCRTYRLLRGRIDGVLRRSGLDPGGHDGKALLAILDSYPRDELFQIDEDTLYDPRPRHPAAAGAPPRGAVRAPRPGRPLRPPAWCSRRASAFDSDLSERFALAARAGLARPGDLDRGLRQHRVPAGPGALHPEARHAGQPDARSRRARARAWPMPRPRGTTGCAWHCRPSGARSRAVPPPANGATISPRPTATAMTPTRRWPTSNTLEAALAGTEFGVRLSRLVRHAAVSLRHAPVSIPGGRSRSPTSCRSPKSSACAC